MPATYEPIATTTLSSAASSITFSSIPGTYTDLRLVLVGRLASGFSPLLRFNGDTGSNYSITAVSGTGSAANSTRTINAAEINLTSQSPWETTLPSMTEIDIFNYAGSTNKTALISASTDRNGSGAVERIVGLYRSTSAITSITTLISGGTYDAGTRFTLYGILKA